MNYKGIGFDWGGVINGKPSKFFGKKVSELLGTTHEKYLEAYFHHNKKIHRGEINWEELWSLVLIELGRPEKVQEVMNISREFNAESLNREVLDLVDKLRVSEYKVGLLSNNTHERAAMMRKKGLDKHFDAFHISAETGFVKPEPEAFAHLAKELGVELNELIFIDDAEKSLSTSKECGFTPILFESYEQLVNDLTKIGIL
jgi:putative hydrolase of the HAD superfamily